MSLNTRIVLEAAQDFNKSTKYPLAVYTAYRYSDDLIEFGLVYDTPLNAFKEYINVDEPITSVQTLAQEWVNILDES